MLNDATCFKQVYIVTGYTDLRSGIDRLIRYHLKKLKDDGVICRFESGVYYIPKINIFGEQSSLSAETVALHKYIFRRPAVEVTEENAYVLQLLDCLKDI